MKRCLAGLALASSALLAASLPGARAEGLGPIADFMVMDVCTGPDGTILRDVPGDTACRRHRDIKPGESPPYSLQNFPAPAAGCPAGPVSKINVPVARDSAIRVISSTLRQVACRAPTPGDEDDLDRSGVSIQWHDDGYGFIMGSYSPVSLSSFESDLCAANPNSSHRFFRGWVIGPAEVPPLGTTGHGVFPTKLQKGSASDNMDACAVRYSRALTTWAIETMTYTSGRALVSIVSSHYAQGAADGQSPGRAMQMEQTFWTREFGLSRWEKWARDDWVHPRSGKSALELGAQLVAAHRCGPPLEATLAFTPAMETRMADKGTGLYSRIVTNPMTGERHRWVMTLCEDYTNIAPLANGDTILGRVSTLADEAYWQ